MSDFELKLANGHFVSPTLECCVLLYECLEHSTWQRIFNKRSSLVPLKKLLNGLEWTLQTWWNCSKRVSQWRICNMVLNQLNVFFAYLLWCLTCLAQPQSAVSSLGFSLKWTLLSWAVQENLLIMIFNTIEMLFIVHSNTVF